jgi:hypothetical protein
LVELLGGDGALLLEFLRAIELGSRVGELGALLIEGGLRAFDFELILARADFHHDLSGGHGIAKVSVNQRDSAFDFG